MDLELRDKGGGERGEETFSWEEADCSWEGKKKTIYSRSRRTKRGERKSQQPKKRGMPFLQG